MPKFMFAYHGGKRPETEAAQEAAMAAWKAWVEEHRAALVDQGAPVGRSSTVSASGVVDNGGANPISGYSIISAASLDAALDMAKSCPVVADESGSVEVAEIHGMAM